MSPWLLVVAFWAGFALASWLRGHEIAYLRRMAGLWYAQRRQEERDEE